MPNDIAFLHTSPVHVPTFDALMRTAAPGLRVAHVVREDLLAAAQTEGVDSPTLVARVRQALAEADARVVVCTCSTLGGIAEDTPTGGAYRVTRIDRAMADAAVRAGPRVLLVATLASTLQPTVELLQSSAARLGTTVVIETLLIADAWPHFQAGRQREYIDTLVEGVARVAARADSVVLAQASMAPAAALLAERGIPALTSPHLGVQHALALLSSPMTSTDPTPYDGGCTCGQVRYRMGSKPLFVNCCHCRWCQRETGASFALNAMIETDRVQLRSGQVERVLTPSNSGRGQTICRCPSCHVAVWSHYAGAGEAVSFVRVGTLDEPDRLPPDIHIFTGSKQPWVLLPPGTPVVPEYYKASEVWPADSLQRRAALMGKPAA